MPALSYNENHHRQTELRHIFLPGIYNLIPETCIALVALATFNLSTVNDKLINKDSGADADPLLIWSQTLDRLLGSIQSYDSVQQVMLFALWAIAGALLYVVLFRSIQLFLRARGNIDQGVHLIRAERGRGAWRWFASLHDIFLITLAGITGAVAVTIGAIVCFGVASRELDYGLTAPLPSNLPHLLMSFAAALLSVRLVVIGISLLSRRFRIWYNS